MSKALRSARGDAFGYYGELWLQLGALAWTKGKARRELLGLPVYAQAARPLAEVVNLTRPR